MNKQQILYLTTLLASTVADAEIIRFNNGDTLHVKLVKQTKLTLTFFHRIIGEETVRKETISNLSDIDLQDLIMLPEGEVGMVAEKEFKTINSCASGAGNIANTDVSIAKRPTGIAKDKVVTAEKNLKTIKEKLKAAENSVILAKGKTLNDGLLGTGWFRGWKSDIEIGLLGAAGSSVNTTFRTAFNTGHEDKEGRWTFKSFYYYSSENQVTSNNKVYATLVKDWIFNDTQWFAFASTTYGMDSFKDWRHRLQLSVGPGYQFVKTERWELSGRMAGTGVIEFNRNVSSVASPNKYSFEVMVGADLILKITEKQRVTISNYFYTNLTDTGAFRNLSTLVWRHDIEWFEGLAIKFGIRNEYDTTQPIHDEFKYNFSLAWGF